MTALGAEFGAAGVTRDDLVFRSDVEGIVTRAMSDVERRLQQFISARIPEQRDPVFNITTPTPVVNVSTPDVVVPASSFAPIIENELPGMEELAVEIRGLRDDLALLVTVLRMPVTRVVHRDMDRLIDTVTETRG